MHRECIPLTKPEFLEFNSDSSPWICTSCIGNIFPFNHILDNVEFIAELEKYHDALPKMLTDLNDDKVFTISDMNDNDFLPLFSCDPDLHFYNDYMKNIFCDSKYYSLDSLKGIIQSTFSNLPKLSYCHLNIRSLPAHIVEFDALLSTLDIKFDVIALTETWLNSQNADLYNLEGYDYVHKYRQGRVGGGASILIKSLLILSTVMI